MNTEVIRARLNFIEKDVLIQNFISQANARYILFNTSESRDNFPPYTIKDENLNILALYYLNLGCCFGENDNLEEAIKPLEKGASLLEFIHGAQNNKSLTSTYYGLVAALAHYVSFQYSKAFILTRKLQPESTIAKLIHLFLSRAFRNLANEIDSLLVNEKYADEFIAENTPIDQGATMVYEIVIARALDGYIKYLYTGNEEILANAKSLLSNLKEIAETESDPGIWWIIRLLLLISEGFNVASLWNTLSFHFDLDDVQVKGYINALVYMYPRGIFELFITQRKALDKVLHATRGCVVSIPTSSGKTRIAEIAILNCMLDNSAHKILYVAPFRSLAFEIENSLEPVLDNAGITVSHLYGGSLYSKLDEKVVEDSDVIIATPEKAKAIIRGNEGLINQIKLIIIDEGHLLGPNKRLITNEIFYEELRFYMEQNGGKFLLLSAVLPNANDLAEWLTKSTDTVYKDNWRPSDERLGILEYNSGIVNLNWISQDSERSSFNNRFIVSEPIPLRPRESVQKYFPGDKNEAIAATAYKLRTFGPVLIFVGIKASVFVMARSYLKCLGSDAENHVWKNTSDWKAFELSCLETYGADNPWYLFAQKGILCHNADLQADVRLPLERLMRSDKPLVIISTSTLGQGVNLGISTVIFSTLYQSGELITARDFWNIAGRSGRAFVDHEGKILVALDSTNKYRRRVKREIDMIKEYFDKDQIDLANSGILSRIENLRDIAIKNDVDFGLLLELISENRTQDIGEGAHEIDEVLDWVDDTLLSLILLNDEGPEIDLSWSDDFFRNSLAYIQAQANAVPFGEDLVSILKARLEGIIEKVGPDRNKWKSIVKSGIPLSTDLIIEEKLAKLIKVVQKSIAAYDDSIDGIIDLLIQIEKVIGDLPIFKQDGDSFASSDLSLIQKNWLSGIAISDFITLDNVVHIITRYYTFKLPWVLNGISKKMRNKDLVDEAESVEKLSILVEAGLPSLAKVKIYQAGIRSRAAANELGSFFVDDIGDRPIKFYKRELLTNKEYYGESVSKTTADWLELLSNTAGRRKVKVKRIGNFRFRKAIGITDTLIAKKINGKQYLISPDLKFIEDVSNSKIDFTQINNIPGITFKFNKRSEGWKMTIINPYVELVD